MPEIDWGSTTVLLVDDESYMRRLVYQMLRSIGVSSVLEAANGVQALELVEKHYNSIDLVLSDLRMPEMDGFELVKAIRDLTNRMASVPIVIMSGHGDAESVEKAKQVGINAFVVKPANRNTLESRLVSAMGGGTA